MFWSILWKPPKQCFLLKLSQGEVRSTRVGQGRGRQGLASAEARLFHRCLSIANAQLCEWYAEHGPTLSALPGTQ